MGWFVDQNRFAGVSHHGVPLLGTSSAVGPAHVMHCLFQAVAHTVIASASMLFAAGCSPAPESRPIDDRMPVFVGIPPLAYLVEQIGGERVKVDVLVQPGQDPHTFQPTPRQVAALGRAMVFFKIDMPFEAVLLEKVQEGNRRLEVVDATHGIQKRKMDTPCSGDNDHAHEPPTHADQLDPHVWLSPPLLKIMADNIAAALCRVDSAHQEEYRRNLASLHGRLDTVHKRIDAMMTPYRGRSFYVFHPGFGYFADAYGLKEEAVEIGGQSPPPKQFRTLIERARAEGATTVFVQPEFAPQSVRIIAEALGGQVVPINGLGKDVIADMEDIAVKIEKSMRESTPRKNKVK